MNHFRVDKSFREYQTCCQANTLNVISSENGISCASIAFKTRSTNILSSSSPLPLLHQRLSDAYIDVDAGCLRGNL